MAITGWRKLKIYLDTSVISYLDQTDVPDKMQETHKVWEMFKCDYFDIVISDVVLEEINKCNTEKRNVLYSYLNQIKYELIKVDDETAKIARKIIEKGILTEKSIADCQHIAVAIKTKCDILVSWNLKHISNFRVEGNIRRLSIEEVGKEIMIFPPYAILEGGYENGIPEIEF